MTVDFVPWTLEFRVRLCTGWEVRNCVCWPFEVGWILQLQVLTKVEPFEDVKGLGFTTTI